MPMERVIKSPEISDPAVLVGDLGEAQGVSGPDAAGRTGGRPGEGDEDDEFLYPYGDGPDSESGEEAEPPPDPLAERRAELEEQAEAERERAREEGHRDGMAAAEAETAEKRQAMEAQLQRLSELVDGVEVDYLATLDELKAQAIELSLAVGEKLALRTLREEEGALAGLFAAAIDRAAADSRLKIRLNPEDEALLADDWEVLASRRNGDVELELVADPGITRGGCLIEAGGGRVDATVESRLDSIREAVTPEAPGEAADAAAD